MTKELLLGELNKNNEFSEVSPIKLSMLMGKQAYIVNKVFICNDQVCNVLCSGEELGCSYIAFGKEYTINLAGIRHENTFDGLFIFAELSKDSFNANAEYYRESNLIKFTLEEPESQDGEPDPCYIDIILNFYPVEEE